jgi:hypothetical protein
VAMAPVVCTGKVGELSNWHRACIDWQRGLGHAGQMNMQAITAWPCSLTSILALKLLKLHEWRMQKIWSPRGLPEWD